MIVSQAGILCNKNARTFLFAVFGRQFGICELAEADWCCSYSIGWIHFITACYAATNVLGSLNPLHELTYVKLC